ncbi:hypothetical protein WME90_45900 [Sorangium sp. So ce375]|uniref:hypothetical protein n=1 Tax=Sorangium sp. So ce375 TaxID=3133306 RepID=UPI003F5C3AE6
MISTCLAMMALGTACRISLDPIGGASGEGTTGGAGAAGATGGAGTTGATGSAGTTGGDVVVPRDAAPLWITGVPGADLNEGSPPNPVVAADGLGNTVVFTVEPGTPLDSFDVDGNRRWSKTFDGAFKYPRDVAVNRSGLIAITGNIDEALDLGGGSLDVPWGYWHAVVGVFNDAGEHIWSDVFSGGGGTVTTGDHIDLDDDGNVIFIGSHDSTVDFGALVLPAPPQESGDHHFIAKLNPTGYPLWAKSYPWNAAIMDMTTDASGNIIIAGNFHGTVNFGGGARTGSCTSSDRDRACDDIFVIKIDADGAYVWDRTIPSGRSTVHGVAVDGSGNIALTGTFWDHLDLGDVLLESRGGPEPDRDYERGPFPAPGGDIFVLKLDPGGNFLWAKSFGDDKAQSTTSIAMTDGGDIALTGYVSGRVDLGTGATDSSRPRAFVTKLDAAGNALWAAYSDSSADTWGTSVTVDRSDNVIAAGLFGDTIDFGAGLLTQPEEDPLLHGFLVKFAP